MLILKKESLDLEEGESDFAAEGESFVQWTQHSSFDIRREAQHTKTYRFLWVHGRSTSNGARGGYPSHRK